jgi:hypothetical protein
VGKQRLGRDKGRETERREECRSRRIDGIPTRDVLCLVDVENACKNQEKTLLRFDFGPQLADSNPRLSSGL